MLFVHAQIFCLPFIHLIWLLGSKISLLEPLSNYAKRCSVRKTGIPEFYDPYQEGMAS